MPYATSSPSATATRTVRSASRAKIASRTMTRRARGAARGPRRAPGGSSRPPDPRRLLAQGERAAQEDGGRQHHHPDGDDPGAPGPQIGEEGAVGLPDGPAQVGLVDEAEEHAPREPHGRATTMPPAIRPQPARRVARSRSGATRIESASRTKATIGRTMPSRRSCWARWAICSSRLPVVPCPTVISPSASSMRWASSGLTTAIASPPGPRPPGAGSRAPPRPPESSRAWRPPTARPKASLKRSLATTPPTTARTSGSARSASAPPRATRLAVRASAR